MESYQKSAQKHRVVSTSCAAYILSSICHSCPLYMLTTHAVLAKHIVKWTKSELNRLKK